jgi:hypothetical protein
MYEWCNIEVHLYNHCCSEKAISNTYSVCVCSLRYPACSAPVPYCHLWPAQLYIIFPHSLINGTIFKNKVTENKVCVLIFSIILSEIFLTLIRIEWMSIKNAYWSSYKVQLFFSDINKTCIFKTDFYEKYWNIKFHENPSTGSWVVLWWQMDIQIWQR